MRLRRKRQAESEDYLKAEMVNEDGDYVGRD